MGVALHGDGGGGRREERAVGPSQELLEAVGKVGGVSGRREWKGSVRKG